MKHAFDLYRRLIGIQIRSQLQYRLAFAFDVVNTASITGIWFVSLALLLERFGGIGGWTLGEVAFLYGMVEAAFGTMDMVFTGFDPDRFSPVIRQGGFDQLMLRPMNLTLQVFGSQFAVRRVGRILQGVIVLGIAFALTDIHWTAAKIAYLPIVFLSMVAFFGGLYVIGSTITFWTIQPIEAVNIFTYGGSEMIAYPMHIYSDGMRRIFTYVIPAMFLNYVPALYFLGKPDPLGLPAYAPFLAPVAGFGVFGVAFAFWSYGIRHYQSTGT